jgi:hypothetical protein
MSAPSFLDRYKAIILDALKHPYVSTSSKAKTKTGNAYQSIDLGGFRTIGGRPRRDIFINHLNLTGKTVLDIGANLGEISRMARHQGASLVDGYEYDNFFVETGRFINAAMGTTRVSLFQGDATDPNLYAGMKYDLVLALAVYVYIEGVLPQIAAITDQLVIETHTLDHGLKMYTDKIERYFPSWQLLGFSDQNNEDRKKSRAMVVFGKTDADVADAMQLTTLRPDNYFAHNFFEKNSLESAGGLAALAKRLRTVSTDRELPGIGPQYYSDFLAGYSDYLDAGRAVTDDNIFLGKYIHAISEIRLAPDLAYLLSNPPLIKEKIAGRFAVLDNADAGNWHLIPPIMVTKGDGKQTFSTLQGDTIVAGNIDGHHRFFTHQLFKRPIQAIMREKPESQKKAVKINYSLAEPARS